MNIFSYLEILKLDKAKIEALRNRDYIQLEKKLISKAKFNSSINKNKVSEFVKILKNNNREIITFFKPPFYGLRKALQHPDRSHTFEIKHSPNSLITDKLIQFIHQNFINELNQYTDLFIKENNLGSLSSILEYKEVLPDILIKKIEHYLIQKISSVNSYLNGNININTSLEDLELIRNRHFYTSLSKISNTEIENSILEFQKLIEHQLIVKNYSSATLTVIDSLNNFETTNSEVNWNKDILNTKKDEILAEEKNKKKFVPKTESTYERKYSNEYSAKGSWKIVLSIVLMLFTIVRFCSRNNSRTNTSNNNNYEQQEDIYRSRDFEIKKIQKDLVYIHTTKEITNTQKEPFTGSRMKFISKYDKFSFPGAHTLIKNKTNKKVVFFFNSDFGGFKYKLIEPDSEVTVIFRYEYFFIFRGDDQHYCVYTDEYGESKVGILFNEFEDEDLDLLKTLYTNEIQKSRKQSEIIISEKGVEINEKS